MASLLPLLRLVRAGALFSPAADVIAGACVLSAAGWDAQAHAMDTGLSALASLLLYAAGMALNDVADVAEDRLQRPERPIPRGEVGRGTAAALGLGLLATALLLSPVRGHHALLAALVLAYDFALKKNALAGALGMALLRSLNLLTAAALAQEWPAPLKAAAAAYAVYVMAVTILGQLEEHRAPPGRAVSALQTAPPIAALMGLVAVQGGPWPAPALFAVPVALFARRNRLIHTWTQPRIRQSMAWLLMGMLGYAACLCLAAGCTAAFAALCLCLPAAMAIGRRLRQQTVT